MTIVSEFELVDADNVPALGKRGWIHFSDRETGERISVLFKTLSRWGKEITGIARLDEHKELPVTIVGSDVHIGGIV